MDFNYTLSLFTILFSAIISGGIAYFTLRRQKDLDFDYDYRKYILEKRKVSYDAIEKMFFLFNQHGNLSDLFIALINSDADEIELYGSKINAAIESIHIEDIWLSSKLKTNLYEFQALLGEVRRRSKYNQKREVEEEIPTTDVDMNQSDEAKLDRFEKHIREEEREELFRKYVTSFMTAHNELWNIYFRDLMNLGNVEEFKKAKLEEVNKEEEKNKKLKDETSDSRTKEKRKLLDEVRALYDAKKRNNG